MKPPLTYYGGKQKLCKTILSLMPEHRIYCEPFFGGGAVFFAKKPSVIEVINDTNGELINFYKVVKTKFSQLKKEIDLTLHSRELHHRASVILRHPQMFNEIERAWAIWESAAQGFGSQLDSTWRYDLVNNTAAKRFYNKREYCTKEYAKRMEKTQIECRDALEVIKLRDRKDTFFYCDPPYYNACMGHYRGYKKGDFEKLLQLLSKIKGKFLLSSYPSELLEKYTRQNKWQTKKIDMALSAGAGEHMKIRRKTEVLTGNYPVEPNQK